MKQSLRAAALALALLCIMPGASAASKAKATATPAPQAITTDIVEPPEAIRQVLDIAYQEWVTVDGKALKNQGNKYQTWWNNYKWEWCAGFVTWCMLEAGIPQEFKDDIFEMEEGEPSTGIFHTKASSPGKMLAGYEHMHRTTRVPQKGFIICYGVKSNGYVHVGFVYDVEELGGGRYRLTTIEGNMSNTVKMYVYDYDMNAEKKNCITAIPEELQTRQEAKNFTYKLRKDGKSKWYVNYFLMPWLPDEYASMQPAAAETTPIPAVETPVPPAGEAAPAEIPAPVAQDAVTLAPLPAATPAPVPAVTAAPVINQDGTPGLLVPIG